MDKIELLDIVAPLAPPPAPPPYGWIALGVGSLLLLMCGLLYLVWRRSRDRRAALAQLKRTARALRHQHVDSRTAAFQIDLALRRVFRTPPSQIHEDWKSFSNALDHARFAPQMPGAHASEQLLARARDFLRVRC